MPTSTAKSDFAMSSDDDGNEDTFFANGNAGAQDGQSEQSDEFGYDGELEPLDDLDNVYNSDDVERGDGAISGHDVEHTHGNEHITDDFVAKEIQDRFGFVPRPQQIQCIRTLLVDQADIILYAKTSLGKSLIFQAAPLMYNPPRAALIIMPLKALEAQQRQTLTRIRGCRPFVLDGDSNSRESRKHIGQGEFTHGMRIYIDFESRNEERIYSHIIAVFTSPEIALSKDFKDDVLSKPSYSDRLCMVNIDELHLCSEWRKFRPKDSMPTLSLAANVGLMLFLIALSLGAVGMALPFGLGCAVAYGLYHQFRSDSGLHAINFGTYMLFVGVAMAITAFPVLCRIFTELKLQSQVGMIVLSVGVGNDAAGWALLALCVALVNAGSRTTALYVLLVAVGYVLFLVGAVRPALLWILRRTGSIQDGPTQSAVALTVLMTLASAFFTGIIGIHPIFGAVLVGLICPHDGGFAVKLTEKIVWPCSSCLSTLPYLA
jgi:hypothetical protein